MVLSNLIHLFGNEALISQNYYLCQGIFWTIIQPLIQSYENDNYRNPWLIQKNNNYSQKGMSQNLADKLINNIVGYSQANGDLIGKYNLDYFLNYFDRNAIIAMSDHLHPHQELTQEQFIRIFLLKIEHTEDETLYLALSLKKLFQSIIERTTSSTTIQFSDFTHYLCQKISKEDLDLVIPSKRIPKQRLSPDSHRIRDIDLEAPLILNKVAKEIPKISKDLPKKNKKLDEKKGVSKFFYSTSERSIIAIGTLSSSIYIYDENLKAKNEITPNQCKQMEKDIGILSMAFNPKSNRIGALLTNASMIFWEGGDRYNTQKVIPNKNYGDKIYYFQLSNQWVTVDRSALHFWDIKQEKITDTIKCKDSVLITDVCEINHLRGICVSLVTNKQEKFLIFYHEAKIMAKLNLGSAGCHTLHYNKLTQSLVPLGYHNTISVYTVQRSLYDIELKYILRGHRSIITCIDSLEQNSLMITGDDIGQIRIWEVTYMRCVQSVKISKWLCGIKLIGNKLFYSDSRINVMELDHFEVPKNQKIMAIYHFYDEKEETIWIITRKDARKIDFKSGKIKRIFVLCGDQQQITSAVQVGDGFVIGNSRGELFHYDSDCNIRWQKIAHENQISNLQYDKKNRLLFTLGSEGKVIAWPERTIQTQQQRKVIVFKSKEANILSISNKSNILIIGNTQQSVFTIWDYQILKLREIVDMQCEISSIFVSEQYDLILIATQDLKLSLIKFMKNQNNLDLKLIQSIDLLNHSHENDIDIRQSIIVGIKIIFCSQSNKKYVTLATNKGVIINFDITVIVCKYFGASLPTVHKQSVNILRNQVQDYESCVNQHGKKITISQLGIRSTQTDYQRGCLIWMKKIFKQCVNCIQCIQMKNCLLSVVGQQSSKIVNIENGQIQAALNINHPLPIKWNLTINHHNHLKKDICEVLKIIDNILKNFGYEMLAREYKMINLTNFMQKINKSQFFLTEKCENISLLSSEYDQHDIIGEKTIQPSLKALEAYKRVKTIKKMSEELMNVPRIMAQNNTQSQIQKEALRQLLCPPQQPFFPSSQKDPYIVDLNNRLMNSLPTIQNKKYKHRNDDQTNKIQFQNGIIRQNNIFKQNHLTRSVIFQKDKTAKWKEQLEEKGMKQILQNLNKKLKSYRLQGIKQNAI